MPAWAAWLLAFNAVTVLVYGYDKAIAGGRRRRVPERTLLGLACAAAPPARCSRCGRSATRPPSAAFAMHSRWWLRRRSIASAHDRTRRRGSPDSVIPSRTAGMTDQVCSTGLRNVYFRAGSLPTHSGVGWSRSKYSKIRWMRSLVAVVLDRMHGHVADLDRLAFARSGSRRRRRRTSPVRWSATARGSCAAISPPGWHRGAA